MKMLVKGMLVVLMLIMVSSCALFDEDEEIKDFTELDIDDNFNFETERWVNVELSALYTGTFYLKDLDDNFLYKGSIDQFTGFVQKIKLPTRIEEVKIEYREVDTETKIYRIRDDEIVYSFVPFQ